MWFSSIQKTWCNRLLHCVDGKTKAQIYIAGTTPTYHDTVTDTFKSRGVEVSSAHRHLEVYITLVNPELLRQLGAGLQAYQATCSDVAWLMKHMVPIPALPLFACQGCTWWHSRGSPESWQLRLRLTLGCPNCKTTGLLV